MSGPATRESAAPWFRRLHHEVQRGRHVLLHGNIADQVLWLDDHGRPEYRSLRAALTEFLAWEGFSLVPWYDGVDGLVFRDDDERQRFDALYRRSQRLDADPADVPGGPDAPDGPAPAPDGAAASPEEARRGRAASALRRVQQAVGAPRGPSYQDPAAALGAVRAVLTQSTEPAAVVLDFADLIFSDPQQPDRAERNLLIQLKKTLRAAAFVGSGGARLRNTIVLLAADLARVPAWLYQDDPHITPMRAELPGMDERRAFVLRYRSSFAGGQGLTDEEAARHAEVVANLTEGMTVWDLEALRRTSVGQQVPLTDPRRLVRLHRFGEREDPWERLGLDRVRAARAELGRRVIGQDAAVGAVADRIGAARVGIDFTSDPGSAATRPRGVFFFVGPTGVGKTELAKALSQFIFDDEAAVARFDMSEFQQEHAAERLTGAPPGYVGYQEGGVLTNRVLERPFSVLLFDEIEKAHPRVLDRFLQILEDGRLTDGMGRTAHFSHSVIIFTSNLGSDLMTARMNAGGEPPPYEEVKELYMKAVREHFTRTLGRPELLSRMGDGILVFDILRVGVIRAIAEKFLGQLSASARAQGYELVFDTGRVVAAVEEAMRDGAIMAMGGRQIRPVLDERVRVPLSRWMVENGPPAGSTFYVSLSPGAAEATFSLTPPPPAAAAPAAGSERSAPPSPSGHTPPAFAPSADSSISHASSSAPGASPAAASANDGGPLADAEDVTHEAIGSFPRDPGA